MCIVCLLVDLFLFSNPSSHCTPQKSRFTNLLGGEKVTNYVHMLGAGHISWYLRQFKNLYKFSQQGWEALNKKMKHFFNCNTNHGGMNGKGGDRFQHCLPVMRMNLRFLLWKTGDAKKFFLARDEANEEERKEKRENRYKANLEG